MTCKCNTVGLHQQNQFYLFNYLAVVVKSRSRSLRCFSMSVEFMPQFHITYCGTVYLLSFALQLVVHRCGYLSKLLFIKVCIHCFRGLWIPQDNSDPRHFGTKTFRHRDSSVLMLRHSDHRSALRTLGPDSSTLVPKCQATATMAERRRDSALIKDQILRNARIASNTGACVDCVKFNAVIRCDFLLCCRDGRYLVEMFNCIKQGVDQARRYSEFHPQYLS